MVPEDKSALAVRFSAMIAVNDFQARLFHQRTEKGRREAHTVEWPFPFPLVSRRILVFVFDSLLDECRQKNTASRLEHASEFPQVCAHIPGAHV